MMLRRSENHADRTLALLELLTPILGTMNTTLLEIKAVVRLFQPALMVGDAGPNLSQVAA